MQHQLDVLRSSARTEFYAVFWEMGVGKTKLALDTAACMFVEKRIDGLLFIAPKGCYLNTYYNEVPLHMSARAPYRMEFWSATGGKKKERSVNALTRGPAPGFLDIFVVNIESLRSGRGKVAAMKFVRTHKTLTIIDESTAIKNPKAAQTKACVEIGQHSEYRRIMTGTPITQDPLDLYSQFDFLCHGCLGFTNFYSFRAEYARMQKVQMNGRSINIVRGFRNLEDLKHRIAPHSSRISKEECLDLPPKTFSVEYVELTSEQKKAYQSMKELCLTQLETEVITVTNALTMLGKLQQIICGHIIDENGLTHDIKSNRIATLIDILARHGGKAIIWCKFRHDIRAVCAALSDAFGEDSFVPYFGDTKDAERKLACDRIQADDSCRFMVASKSAAKGLTLTTATLNVYYSLWFELETYLQSQDRTHRKGQTQNVHNINLIVRGTVDEKIVKALASKKDIAGSIVDGVKMLFT